MMGRWFEIRCHAFALHMPFYRLDSPELLRRNLADYRTFRPTIATEDLQ